MTNTIIADKQFSKVRFSTIEYEALQIKERISAVEVAKRMRLPAENNVLDHIDLTLTPYHILPLEMIGRDDVLFIYAIAPTQSGKTLLAQVYIADRIDQTPGTILYVLPTKDSGEKQFQEKVIGLIKNTPDLYKHTLKPEKHSLTLKGIRLDNMSIFPAWSNAENTMNSITCIGGVLDEIRLMKVSGTEGTNAIEYMGDRAKTYMSSGRAQFMGVTTPAYEGDLMSRQLLKPHTSVYWWATRCQGCDKVQVLDIYENFPYNEDTRTYAPECLCKYCEHPFDDFDQKREMNLLNVNARYIRWDEQGKLWADVDEIDIQENMIFRWVSENSPFSSFEAIARKYDICKDDFAALNNFDTCWRARFLAMAESKVTKEMLKSKTWQYSRGVVPDWCQVITAGLDAQRRGFPFTVWAHGHGGKQAMIDFGTLESDSHFATDPEVTDLFQEYFEDKIYTSESGVKWALGLWAGDTGGERTSQMYSSMAPFKKCVPCKGSPKSQEVNMKVSKAAVIQNLYLINTFNYLQLTDVQCMGEHFYLLKENTEEFRRQYCNLKIVKEQEKDKTGTVVEYIKKGDGLFDYRIAHLHAQGAMDVPIAGRNMTFRQEIHNPDWKYNPVDRLIIGPPKEFKRRGKLKSNKKAPSIMKRKPIIPDYDVGGFTDGGVSM